jgi:hypothetical protein
MNDRIEQLRAELMAAEAAEASLKEDRKLATPVRYSFRITPAESRAGWDRLYDSTCKLYTIKRHVLNRDEAKAAGHNEWALQEGSARYLFNTVTNRIICSVSGGTMYVSDGLVSNDGADDIAFEQIGLFLHRHPTGGDITEYIEQFQATRNT